MTESTRTCPDATPRAVGLSSAEAARRLAAHGPNVLVPEAKGSRIRRLVGPLADPMVLLLLVAAPTYLLIGETVDAIVAFVALVPTAAVGWLLESRAERTLEQLRRLAAPTAVVVRDGVAGSVPVEELVVGDAVVVREGDVVPADLHLLESTQAVVDEGALTGESLPIEKVVGGDDETSTLWAGTTVLSGRATAEVVSTGTATRYGHIGRLVAQSRPPATPLQRALARLVRAVALVALVFCLAVVVAELVRGRGWGSAIIAGVSLAIAAIPEEFSMVYALYLALGAWRLAQDRALVRKMPSVETLGSATVICTDKTGTLTEGRLSVAGLWTPHSPQGDGPARRRLLEAAVRACEPDAYDPLDLAIIATAAAEGVVPAHLHGAPMLADWPFDPVQRYLTHSWQGDGVRLVAAKGALEGVLAHCRVDEAVRLEVQQANERFAADGMRVIAVAAGVSDPATTTRAGDEAGLELCGLVAFSDPVREGVVEALAACRAAGIRVVMITGDHPITAHAVAEALQLPHELDGEERIATGDDLDRATPAELDELVRTTNVFARTRPEQKHLLVTSLRAHGEVVAMTGDGINDAPALREADIGVAMGERGTEVARAAASMVLLDDNFTTIVHAVRDGRRVFDNLTRAFAYLVAFHPPLLLAALVIPVMGRPLLLLPIHLVVLELLLHPIVSLVFQADPAAPGTMERPPRPVGEALRLRALGQPYFAGTLLAVAIIVVYLWALRQWPEDQARAVGFCTLLASQPLLLLGARSPDRPFWRSGRAWTPTLWTVVAVLVVVCPAAVYVPALAHLMHLAPFPAGAWAVVLLAASSAAWLEPWKRPTRTP